jgi:hypothetical protein
MKSTSRSSGSIIGSRRMARPRSANRSNWRFEHRVAELFLRLEVVVEVALAAQARLLDDVIHGRQCVASLADEMRGGIDDLRAASSRDVSIGPSGPNVKGAYFPAVIP